MKEIRSALNEEIVYCSILINMSSAMNPDATDLCLSLSDYDMEVQIMNFMYKGMWE